MTDWIRDGRLAEATGGPLDPGDRPGDDLRLDGDAAGAQGALRGRGHDRRLELRARAVRDREGLRRLSRADAACTRVAALGAATCWALTGIIAAEPAAHLGALAFNRWRQVFATVCSRLCCSPPGSGGARRGGGRAAAAVGALRHLRGRFAAFHHAQPARAAAGRGALRANAPIAAVIAWLALGETLAPRTLAGIALTVGGVALAIVYGSAGRSCTPGRRSRGRSGSAWRSGSGRRAGRRWAR